MPQRPRRVPQRTCVACRGTRGKREMVRIVHSPSGQVVVDTTGKANGRGAYLCPRRPCWQQGLARRALETALKAQLSAEDRAALERYAADLPE